MPQDGYTGVSVPNGDYETAKDYKPDGVTWGDVVVAGAERLNEHLDSDTQRFADDVDADAIADAVAERLAGGAGPAVNTDALLADLKSQLPAAVADELEGRLR